jgi:hypothetical protein
LVLAAALAGTGSAQAHPKHLNGFIGMTVGRPVIPTNKFEVRFGVRKGTSGGSRRWHGFQVGKGSRCCRIGTSWLPFDISRWSFHQVMVLGATTAVTVTACTAFGAAAAAETPSLFADTWVAALAAASCEHGAVQLHKQYEHVELNPRG